MAGNIGKPALGSLFGFGAFGKQPRGFFAAAHAPLQKPEEIVVRGIIGISLRGAAEIRGGFVVPAVKKEIDPLTVELVRRRCRSFGRPQNRRHAEYAEKKERRYDKNGFFHRLYPLVRRNAPP